MGKSQDAKKNVKKAPTKTPKEKKEAKRLKKAEKKYWRLTHRVAGRGLVSCAPPGFGWSGSGSCRSRILAPRPAGVCSGSSGLRCPRQQQVAPKERAIAW